MHSMHTKHALNLLLAVLCSTKIDLTIVYELIPNRQIGIELIEWLISKYFCAIVQWKTFIETMSYSLLG